MKRLFLVAAALLFCCAAYSQIGNFPPGMFSNKASLDPAAAAAAYSGPGDVVSGALMWTGLRGYNGAYAGNAANICTPLDALCLDVTIVSGNLNTTTLGTLACNNSTTLCTVKTLYDQSGNTNCGGAACDLTNVTIANRPLYVAPGAANGCPTTALPCMSFNGTSQRLASAGALTQSQPFTYSAIGNSANNGALAALFGSSNSGILPNTFGANDFNNYCSGSNVATAADNTWHAAQAVCNNTASDMNVDGVASIGTTSTSNTTTAIEFGSIGGASFFKGKAFEGGMWGIAFSGAQSISMSANQHGYGGW